ncbi:AEC family transporter [Mesorhizobium sp. NBSH29]|uniref:AEC family transporter n=1 Tax=Mesorhizobium sp. NBSH29 TaxID=2654249 RepID=UPI00189692E4|nr:AEC family transporter [Mesorhizobium sp. NBSH29]QPC88052.1 AEC family transporter [Mesorhizobium sp. NBSH29]
MSPLTETVLFVFGLIALGYLSGLTGYLSTQTGDSLSAFAVGVALPLLLFRTMIHADFHGAAPWALWATYFTSVIVAWTAGHLVITRAFGRDGQAGVVGGVATSFSNLLLLGAPFMLGVFGQEGFGILSLIIAIHLPSMMMASIILFEVFGRHKNDPTPPLTMARDFLRRIGTNPLIIGVFFGLVWRFSGLSLPPLATRLVDSLAGIAGPLALFAMGLGLRKFGISGHVAPAAVLSALKLFLMPAVALLMAWLLGLPPLSAKVAVAAAALPSGVNSYLIATQFGTGQALASNQMTIATVFAVVTTAFWLMVVQAIFG